MLKPIGTLPVLRVGFEFQCRVEGKPKAGSYHQLEVEYVMAKLGGHSLETSGRQVVVYVKAVKDSEATLRVKWIDTPRWMHQQSQKGYTTVSHLAVLDAGEVLTEDAATYAEHETAYLLNLREQLEGLGDRYERLQRQAEENGVDVTRQARAIQRQIRTMERKVASAKRAA